MKDPKEQELIEARDEAYRKLVEANLKWDEAYRKLWKYRESKAQQDEKAPQ